MDFRSEEPFNQLFMPTCLCSCTRIVQVRFIGKGCFHFSLECRHESAGSFSPSLQRLLHLHLLPCYSGSSAFPVLFHVIFKSPEIMLSLFFHLFLVVFILFLFFKPTAYVCSASPIVVIKLTFTQCTTTNQHLLIVQKGDSYHFGHIIKIIL